MPFRCEDGKWIDSMGIPLKNKLSKRGTGLSGTLIGGLNEVKEEEALDLGCPDSRDVGWRIMLSHSPLFRIPRKGKKLR